MTGFIGLFDTARDYILQITLTHTPLSTVTYSLPLLGSGFQQRMFPESFDCDVCDRPRLPSLSLGFLGDYSSTAPAVPSKCATINIFLKAVLWTSLLLFPREPTPPQCPVTHFPQSNGSSNCSLFGLQLYGLPEDPPGWPLLSQM
jgi:hypothetical protein